MKTPTGLYLHIPFCEHKCGYCDFYSATNFERFNTRFVKSLQKELQHANNCRGEIDSLFFGGGTPSLLSVQQLELILETVHKTFSLRKDCEITIETNPETVDFNKLKGFNSLGINRISFGVQSFIEHELKFMERIHSAEKAKRVIGSAREAGFDNVSLDLIFALPEQTLSDWEYTLTEAMKLGTDHISAYSLIFEENTPFGNLLKRGKVVPKSQESDREFYEFTIQFLKAHGFHQYEVSNYAKSEAKQSRHNLKYWKMEPYIGFGPSAHSFDGKFKRSWNIRSTEKYISAIEENRSAQDGFEELSAESHMFEWIMLGLRMRQGIHLGKFENKFKRRFQDRFANSIKKYQTMNLLEINSVYCKLTDEGLFYADEIASNFI